MLPRSTEIQPHVAPIRPSPLPFPPPAPEVTDHPPPHGHAPHVPRAQASAKDRSFAIVSLKNGQVWVGSLVGGWLSLSDFDLVPPRACTPMPSEPLAASPCMAKYTCPVSLPPPVPALPCMPRVPSACTAEARCALPRPWCAQCAPCRGLRAPSARTADAYVRPAAHHGALRCSKKYERRLKLAGLALKGG